MSKPTVFITGATGNVGGATFKHLDKNKVNIRVSLAAAILLMHKVGVRRESEAQEFKKKGCEGVIYDLAKKESLLAAFKGVDRLLVVPPNSKGEYQRMTHSCVLDRGQLAVNAIDAAKEVGVKC